MRFTKHLESVTYPKDPTPFPCKPGNALHNRTETGDGPAPKIVPIRESARQNDTVFCRKSAQIGVLVPEHDHFLSQVLLQTVKHITITIRTGENDYSKFHNPCSV